MNNTFSPIHNTRQEKHMNYTTGKFVRSNDKMVAGLCRAIADRTGWDVNLIRLVTALAAVFTSGTVLVAYLIAWAVIPAQDASSTLLNDAINEGKKYANEQKRKRAGGPTQPQPGPTQQTPAPGQAKPEDPFNLYQD